MPAVLFADDDQTLLSGYAALLTFFCPGVEMVGVEDGAQALRALEERPFSLLITDLEMPVLNGYELIRHCKERWPTLPIVVLSGAISNTPELFHLGATQVLPKSVGIESLVQQIQLLLVQQSPKEPF